MTQGEIAEKAHISVSFLSMIERGERSAGLETLSDIADALGTSLVDFFSPDDFRPQTTPAYHQLAAFLHKRKVTRRQVQQLLAVAEAMFSD